jgi:hypothetical protein
MLLGMSSCIIIVFYPYSLRIGLNSMPFAEGEMKSHWARECAVGLERWSTLRHARTKLLKDLDHAYGLVSDWGGWV